MYQYIKKSTVFFLVLLLSSQSIMGMQTLKEKITYPHAGKIIALSSCGLIIGSSILGGLRGLSAPKSLIWDDFIFGDGIIPVRDFNLLCTASSMAGSLLLGKLLDHNPKNKTKESDMINTYYTLGLGSFSILVLTLIGANAAHQAGITLGAQLKIGL